MTDQRETSQPQLQVQILAAQLQQMREIIAQQQAQLQSVQMQLAAMRPVRAIATETGEAGVVVEATEANLPEDLAEPLPGTSEPRPAKTSRRRLLTTAGAAAAAATVATVALSSGEVAHAATGDNLVLGQSNDAGATTSLTATTGTTPNPLLYVDNSGASGFVHGLIASASDTGHGVQGYSPSGYGISGSSDSGVGAGGYSTSGTGVFGSSSTGMGVLGTTGSGPGVSGISTGGIGPGVSGSAGTGGVGVEGHSEGGIDVWASGSGVLKLSPRVFAGPSGLFGNRTKGEIFQDSTGNLWLCIAGTGSDKGTWVQMAHLAPGATTGGAITYLAKPIRLLDTRSGQPALITPSSPFAGGSTHAIPVAGDVYNSVTVPASAVGAIGNVTVANPSGGGYLALVPHGAGFSGTAILAFSAGQVVSNSFNVGLASGQLDIIIGGSGSMTTDVILDLFAVVA